MAKHLWVCDWCKWGLPSWSQADAEEHEKTCARNPVMKTCATCKYYFRDDGVCICDYEDFDDINENEKPCPAWMYEGI